MKITMKLIAEKAGVSLSTVSRVLNNPESVEKSKVTIVNKWIDELNYQPNLAAQSLKKSKSFLIGISVPNMTNPYFVQIVEYLEGIATKNGYNIILHISGHSSGHNQKKELEHINNFIRRNVDGVILVATCVENLNYLKNRNIPHITLTNQFLETNSISTHHKYGGALVADHFIRQGRINLGYIGVKNDEKSLGFKSELYEKGFEVSDKYDIIIPSGIDSDFEISNYIKEFLNTHNFNPDGVFAGNDVIAYELIKELENRNINVPKDIAVVGFDNTILSQILKITSVNQPIKEIVEKGFQILLEQIKEEKFIHIGNFQILPSLTIRKSSV